MAHRFIVGEHPKAAMGDLRDLWKDGVASSRRPARRGDGHAGRGPALRRTLLEDALTTLVEHSDRWPERPQLERDTAGPLPRANLSVKVSALTPLLRPENPQRGKDDAAERLRGLLRQARDLGAHLHIDMESLDSRDAVLELVLELLAEEEFLAGPSAGLVLQAYLRDSPGTLDTILAWLKDGAGARREVPLTVRLVKGAYWDHEIVEARQHGWQVPVFDVKAECDLNFEQLTRRLIDARVAGLGVRVAIASHNLRSIAHAIAYNRLAGGADEDLELQVLRGLGDPLQEAIASQHLRVRAYCPVGDLVAGMAYLVRRLLENTSNESFLQEQARGVPLDELLAPPRAEPAASADVNAAFANEPILELRRAPRARAARRRAGGPRRPAAAQGPGVDRRGPPRGRGDRLDGPRHARPRRRLRRLGHRAGGRRRAAGRPARRPRLGRDAGAASAPTSSCGPPAGCASAGWRRAALAVRECAKPWPEADADVCEAIDFLEYYARGALDIAQGAPILQVPGERNEMRYAPRGIVAVVSPWNFPLAIPLGMTCAGLATGNAVVLKPAEQSPGLRAAAVPRAARGRRPARRRVAAARRGRDRRGAGARPARAHDRLHRLGQRRAGDRARGRPAAARARSTSSA